MKESVRLRTTNKPFTDVMLEYINPFILVPAHKKGLGIEHAIKSWAQSHQVSAQTNALMKAWKELGVVLRNKFSLSSPVIKSAFERNGLLGYRFMYNNLGTFLSLSFVVFRCLLVSLFSLSLSLFTSLYVALPRLLLVPLPSFFLSFVFCHLYMSLYSHFPSPSSAPNRSSQPLPSSQGHAWYHSLCLC